MSNIQQYFLLLSVSAENVVKAEFFIVPFICGPCGETSLRLSKFFLMLSLSPFFLELMVQYACNQQTLKVPALSRILQIRGVRSKSLSLLCIVLCSLYVNSPLTFLSLLYHKLCVVFKERSLYTFLFLIFD